MTEDQHIFKKIEQIGDRVLRLAAVELCNEIVENRYKSAEIIDYLGSTKVFGLIARYKKLEPHKNDPAAEKGHSRRMASAYEYSIGKLYYDDKVKALTTAKEDLAHFYENQDQYFIKKNP
ncbi:MAG: hypothetical protein QM731_05545 [Chitinophagaceae bacterium]